MCLCYVYSSSEQMFSKIVYSIMTAHFVNSNYQIRASSVAAFFLYFCLHLLRPTKSAIAESSSFPIYCCANWCLRKTSNHIVCASFHSRKDKRRIWSRSFHTAQHRSNSIAKDPKTRTTYVNCLQANRLCFCVWVFGLSNNVIKYLLSHRIVFAS